MHLLDIRIRSVRELAHIYGIGDVVKHTPPGKHQMELELAAYPEDRSLCVLICLGEYEKRTKDKRRKQNDLLISYIQPHGRVSKATVSRWTKTMLIRAGIDMKIFTPHSMLAASTSKASRACVPLETIMKTAGWSRSSTFRVYYDKPVHTVGAFGLRVLDKS